MGYTLPTLVGNYDQPQWSFDDVTAHRGAAVDPRGRFRGGVAPIRD
jgi:hypothetical protein